jgi:hypothetical protein
VAGDDDRVFDDGRAMLGSPHAHVSGSVGEAERR